MSSYRSIQPGPSQGRPQHYPYESAGVRRRSRNATQACHFCRQSKIKCTGETPRCSNCVAKDKACGYEGDPAITRQEATKSRLENLERLFAVLQARDPAESEQLLQRIRTGENLATLVDGPTTVRPSLTARPREEASPASASNATSHTGSSEAISSWSTASPAAGKGKGILTTSSSEDASVVEPGMALLGDSSASAHLLIQNQAEVRRAIEGFFGSTGKLFQLFSRDQVSRYHDMVFIADPTKPSKVAVCCVALVAAMGLQYEQSAANASRKMMDDLYRTALHYYEDVIVEHPLDAIKVSGLLAMFNIFDKATISLAYIEVGLGIAKRHGLDKKWHDPSIPAEIWVDYRKSWRTLMFISSWLSFTLGYISGVNTGMQEKIALSEFDVDNSTNIVDLVQSELTKISILKADILRLNLVFKDLSFLTIESILLDLREWHGQLPFVMRLENVRDANLPWNLRLTIYHTHLLYLGAFMLLYRRIASQIVRSREFSGNRTLPWLPSKDLARCAEQGVQAAKKTARILATLMEEKGIFKKCWLVIYQAYTACTVILYAVAQKQLHCLPSVECEDDLEQARICLKTLEFCGSCDPVAHKFHTKLLAIYEQLAGYTTDLESILSSDAVEAITNSPLGSSPEYLLQFPEDASAELTTRALDMLVMLCKPFGGLENKDHVDESIEQAWKTDPTRYEHPQLIERLEWSVEKSIPFQWDLGQLVGSGGLSLNEPLLSPLPSRFLGSSHPNGWSVFLDPLRGEV